MSLLNYALLSGSCHSYQRACHLFMEFHKRFFKTDSPRLPLSTTCLVLFISSLDERKLAHSTITSYLSAIGYVHKMKGLPDPTKTFLIHKLLSGLGRQKSPDVGLPILKPILHDPVHSDSHQLFGSATYSFLSGVCNSFLWVFFASEN